MRVILALAFVLASIPARAKGEALAKIKANCKEDWSTDYSMQEFCIDQQVSAIKAVAKIHQSLLNDDEPHLSAVSADRSPRRRPLISAIRTVGAS